MEVKDIPGFEGYVVDDEGGIWSRFMTGGYPSIRVDGVTHRRLKGAVRPDGYVTVTLSRLGRPYQFLAHRIVLLAWIGPCPNGMVGCHCDGDKLNNHPANLRYDTPSANAHDKVIHGTLLR